MAIALQADVSQAAVPALGLPRHCGRFCYALSSTLRGHLERGALLLAKMAAAVLLLLPNGLCCTKLASS